jgi:adenylosuccinate synthase
LTLKFNEEHNKTEGGMGEFRAGHFDSVLARYAITVCGGIDSMALTHMDRAEESRVCTSYYPEDPGYSHGVLKPYSVRTDLAGQAKLTEKLSQVAPRYSNRTFMKWYKDKDLFSADTVLVESYGPSASDKRVPSRRKLQTA